MNLFLCFYDSGMKIKYYVYAVIPFFIIFAIALSIFYFSKREREKVKALHIKNAFANACFWLFETTTIK